MKKHLLFTVTIFFLSITSSKGQFVNYENDYGWNLGFNIGGVWQQNDFVYTPKEELVAAWLLENPFTKKNMLFFLLTCDTDI